MNGFPRRYARDQASPPAVRGHGAPAVRRGRPGALPWPVGPPPGHIPRSTLRAKGRRPYMFAIPRGRPAVDGRARGLPLRRRPGVLHSIGHHGRVRIPGTGARPTPNLSKGTRRASALPTTTNRLTTARLRTHRNTARRARDSLRPVCMIGGADWIAVAVFTTALR